jgi:hypothetical protein
LDAIRTDGDTQTRVAMDVAAITDYAEAMADGVVFPPIVVYREGSDYWLADGFHRVAAARKAHLTTLSVRRLPTAIRFPSGPGAQHPGGRRTPAGLSRVRGTRQSETRRGRLASDSADARSIRCV